MKGLIINRVMLGKLVKPRFNISAIEIKKLAEDMVLRIKQVDNKIMAIPRSERTFQNTVKPLLVLDHSNQAAIGSIFTLKNVGVDKDVRDASNEGSVLIQQSSVDRMLQNGLYTALSEFDEDRKKRNESFAKDEEKYLDDFLKSMRRNGAHLSVEKRKQYEEVMKRIVALENEFSKTLAEEKTELRFTKEELGGVSEQTLEAFPRDGDLYVVTMKYPHVFPVLDFCSVAATRMKVYQAFAKRGGEKNLGLLSETLELRKKAVTLLGYKDYPTYALENTMAKTPERVEHFLMDLKARLTESGKQEMETLRRFKKECGDASEFEAWDFSFYSNKLKEKLYHVDEEVIKEYFPTEHVVEEMMKIYQEIFGLVFEE